MEKKGKQVDKYDNYLRMEMRLKYPAMAKSKKEYRTITDLFYIINRYKKDFLSFSKKLFVGAKYLNQSALEAKIQTHFVKSQARNLITFFRLYNENKINYNNDTKAKSPTIQKLIIAINCLIPSNFCATSYWPLTLSTSSIAETAS